MAAPLVRARHGLIRLRGQSVAALFLVLLAGLARGADHPAAGATAGDQLKAHVVAEGETLYGIARSLGVPVAVLQSHNGIADPTTIKPGTRLTAPATHTVVAGETLYAIGRRYAVPVDAVLEANGINDPTTIAVGTLLVLPPDARVAIASSAAPTPGAAADAEVGLTTASASAAASGTRLWPVAGPRRNLNGKLTGTIIESTEGAPIVSVSSGVVRWASVSRGYGRVIFVQNPLGYIFGYLGIADSLVAVGDRVAAGTEIARLGRNPHDNAANLYFLVFKDGSPIDPVDAPRV